jgi:hypothetical protein
VCQFHFRKQFGPSSRIWRKNKQDFATYSSIFGVEQDKYEHEKQRYSTENLAEAKQESPVQQGPSKDETTMK